MSNPDQDFVDAFGEAEYFEAHAAVEDVDARPADSAGATDAGADEAGESLGTESLDVGTDTVTGSDGWPEGPRRELHKESREEYGETRAVAVRVPLMILTAPDVPGCKATMTRASSNSAGWSFELSFIGGVSAEKKVTLSWSNEVGVRAGRANEIFLPVWVDVQEVTVFFGGGREEQVRHEVTLRAGDLLKPKVGVRALEGWSHPDGHQQEVFQALLSEQSPDDDPVNLEFAYESEASGELSVGFEAFGAKHKIKISATRTRGHTLAVDLTPGHDYRGFAGVWPPYLAWKVDGA